jgi:hypothetical protein
MVDVVTSALELAQELAEVAQTAAWRTTLVRSVLEPTITHFCPRRAVFLMRQSERERERSNGRSPKSAVRMK